MQQAVLTEDQDRVRVVCLNRPESLNAMNQAVMIGLRDALRSAEDDNGVAVCIITGEGRAFCAGQDMAEMQTIGKDESFESQFPTMLKTLTNFSKPLLAAVNGIGVGIGMTMLAHCDLVMMAKSAKLRTPFPQLGLAPEAASSYTFPNRMGWQNAAYTLMSGRWFNADECLEMGLVWRLFDEDCLFDEVLKIAQELAQNPIPSLVATKQLMLDAGRSQQAWAAHQREVNAYASLMGSPANREAVAAFFEKREPDFSKFPGL
ncbi:MAG: enoyl-CoA hydratase/isomerase family protein [Gammaproteobacteria bacterium]